MTVKYLIQRTIKNFFSFYSNNWPGNPIKKYKFGFSCIILNFHIELVPNFTDIKNKIYWINRNDIICVSKPRFKVVRGDNKSN